MTAKKAKLKIENVAEQRVDPTLPFTLVTTRFRNFKLCFDYGALARGEQELNAQGHDVSLLYSMPRLNFANVPIIFAVAVRAFHPGLEYDDAIALVGFDNVWLIANVIQEAWRKAFPDAIQEDTANPLQPAQ